MGNNRRIITGIATVNKLKFKLERVGEDLREAIIDKSDNQKQLMKEYKSLQSELKIQEEKLEKLKKEQKQKDEREQLEEQKRKEKEKEEEDKFKQYIIESKNEQIEEISKRQVRINKKIENLEYKKEQYLQNIGDIETQISETQEEFEIAKQSGTVEGLIDLTEKLEDMKKQREKYDKELSHVNTRLTFTKLIKLYTNEYDLNKIKDIIEEYNEEAEELGLETIDIDKYINENNTENQLNIIRKEQQKHYKMNNIIDSDSPAENNLLENNLTDDARKKIEKDSEQRLKEKKENSLPVRIIKTTGNAVAKAAGTVVGSAILVGRFIKKSAKKLWNNMRKGANDGLIGANKLMLNGTTKLREKLEKDAKVYEDRDLKLNENASAFEKKRNELVESLQSEINTEIAVNNSEINNEQKTKENEEVQDQE